LFWIYIYIHCTYRNYHDSNAILFDVIVIHSIDLSWTQRMGRIVRELRHRTTTILSVYLVLMFPDVVDGVIAWRCYYVQRGDVTVQSTTLNTDIQSYEALPTLSIHWITFALSNHSQRRHRIYNPPRVMKLSYITFRFI